MLYHSKLQIGHGKAVWDGENWNLNDSLTDSYSKFAEAEHCTAKTHFHYTSVFLSLF